MKKINTKKDGTYWGQIIKMSLTPKQKDKLSKEPKIKLCKHCLEPPMYCTCIEEIIEENKKEEE